jgi:small conductance mechanosensitive channel
VFFLLQTDPGDESTGDKIEDWLLDHGLTIAAIVLFVLVTLLIINLIVPRVVRVTTRTRLSGKPEEEIQQRTDTLTHVFTRTGAVVLLVIGFVTILPELGVNIGALIAGVGIAGIAIGFGAQSLVKDVISGTFILLDNQYGRGDVVSVGGTTGVVEDVGLRRTVLRDLDGVVHFVPNGTITVASNFTQEYSRVNMNISVSYAEDLDRVMRVIDEVGRELAADVDWKDVIITPPASLRIDSFGESGVEIKILGDVQPIRQWEVMGELRRRLKKRFDEEGIEIPFPHRVMVHEAKSAGLPADVRLAQAEERSEESEKGPSARVQDRLPDGSDGD